MSNLNLLVIESEKKKRRPSENADVSFNSISVGGPAGITISKDGNGNFDFAAKTLSNVATPVLGTDAANKDYVDGVKTFTNIEGATISLNQIVFESSSGNVELARADDLLNTGTTFGIVVDATVPNLATGNIAVKPGPIIGGFTGLTVNAPVYVSRVTAGALTQSLTGFLAGEHVVIVGFAISATQIIFEPAYKVEY